MTLALAVLVPIVAAAAAFVAPRSIAATLGAAGAALTALAGAGAVAAVAVDGPLGIALRADGFSAVMLAMTTAIGVGVSAYAFRSLPAGDGGAGDGGAGAAESFWPLWLLLWGALNAVFCAGDAFNVYVALDLVTLEQKREALAGAMRYLLASLLGSLAYLLGVALLYGETGTIDLAGISAQVEPGVTSAVAIAAMTAGLMVKAALFPLHFWLPGAHSNAPAPVSAALSGLVVTAAAYLVLRLWLFVLDPALSAAAAETVAGLGAAAIVWGSLQALRAPRLKLIVAYSTVAQIGYLFVLIALVWDGEAGAQAALAGSQVDQSGAAGTAWQGGVYQAVAHALAKAALFLAAGNIVYSVGSDRLAALRGLPARLPLTMATIAIAGHSLAGLPPSGGFTAKWLMLVGAVEQGAWWWALVLVGGGLLTVAYMLRAVTPAFGRGSEPPSDTHTDPPPASHRPAQSVPRAMEIAALALALAALGLGIRGEELVLLLEVGA